MIEALLNRGSNTGKNKERMKKDKTLLKFLSIFIPKGEVMELDSATKLLEQRIGCFTIFFVHSQSL